MARARGQVNLGTCITATFMQGAIHWVTCNFAWPEMGKRDWLFCLYI